MQKYLEKIKTQGQLLKTCKQLICTDDLCQQQKIFSSTK